MKKAVSIRVIILAAAVVCLVIWGAWKNLPTTTEPQRLEAAAVAEELLGAKVPQGGANALLAQENTAQPADYTPALQALAADILLAEYYAAVGGEATQAALQPWCELMLCRLAAIGLPPERCAEFAAAWKAHRTLATARGQGAATPVETLQALWESPSVAVLLYRCGVDVDAALAALPKDAEAVANPPAVLRRMTAKLKKELTR